MSNAAPFAAALLALAPASAGAAERNFSVTDFDRIRVDGPYRVVLTTGVSPFARASGAAAALNGLALDVQGRTLVVRAGRSGWGGYPGEPTGPVEIAVGTHDLRSAWVNGSGSLIVDKVKGLSFDLSLQGSGSAEIASASVDQLKVAISGAASAKLSGTAPKVTAIIRGTSTLEADQLTAKDATIGAEGPSTVSLTATGTATVDATGTSSVRLSGEPACIVRASGSAVVAGCGATKAR